MSVHDFWTPFALEPFLNALIVGLSIASIWLVAALGLTIIYGTMGVINMAHGEFIMLGAYSTYVLQSYLGFPFLLCLPAAFFIVAGFGWVIEKVLIRHLYQRPLDTLLATWGVSLVLIQGVRLVFGGEPQYVGVPTWLDSAMQIGFINLAWLRVFIIVVSGLMVLLTWWILFRTVTGVRIRAVMQNKEMAASFGINANQVYSITFAYGAGVAGVAGALFGAFKSLFPDMGSGYIVEAFLVVVVGGGQLIGSVFSAGLMGEMGSVFSYFTNDTFARFVLFTLIVVFLRFRPQGLISEAMTRR
ncbi:MAG: urea ABC transporter permease subunit UrtB [Rhodospirillaceae bacterium]|nr:urea ABC transporter permease subunit UrtB [Rhodospirillaceae bacterium]